MEVALKLTNRRLGLLGRQRLAVPVGTALDAEDPLAFHRARSAARTAAMSWPSITRTRHPNAVKRRR